MSVLGLRLFKAMTFSALILAAAPVVHAQAFLKVNVTPEGIGSFFKSYYRAPQPEQIAPIIQTALGQGAADTRAKRLTLIAFMAGLIADDARAIDRLAPVFAKLPDDESHRLIRAILYAGRTDWKEQISRLKTMWPDKVDDIDRIAANGSKAVFHLKRDGQPEVLDMNWAFFRATGWREPVMTVIEWLGDLRHPDPEKAAAAHLARLSLVTHAIEHPRVFDICLRAQWGSFGDHLRLIVAAAQTKDASRIRAETEAAVQAAKNGLAVPIPSDPQISTARSRRP